ncbi:MAG TPA: MarR family transcriptional regulator [Pseudolabrys sp.]|nr:MarR family transcriptional regulator [Pseudolabrys sp.]
MPTAKRAAKKAKKRAAPKSLALRKALQPRRVSETVIDLGVLNRHLGYFVRRLQIWIFQDFIRTLSPIDISPAQFSVLVVIGANEGLSQSELATTLGIERARLVRLLHLLEKRGLTQRLPSSADGRRHALRLTRAGQTQLRQAQELAAQHEEALKPRLGGERYRLLLETLRDF